MHDPPCPLTLGCASTVEHKGLLHANDVLLAFVTLGLDDPVLAGGLPVSSFGGPI